MPETLLSKSCAPALLLAVVGRGSLQAQYNPEGWIRMDAWNMLLPLYQDWGCTAGGEDNMLRSWVAPHDIRTEDPKAGTTWADIDFGAAALANGYGGSDLFFEPQWITTDFLKAAYPALNFFVGDLVDFRGLIDGLNADVVAKIPGATPLPSDNVLALATTYVNNITGKAVEVALCGSGDDGLLVWVNNMLAKTSPVCRENVFCARCILPPGTSKIAALVWEGGGGWSLLLGVKLLDSDLNERLRDGNGVLQFLGPGGPEERGQKQYGVERAVSGSLYNCPPLASAKVTLSGSGPGNDADLVTLEETILADVPSGVKINQVENGGVVADHAPKPEHPIHYVVGPHFQDKRAVGNVCGWPTDTTYDPATGEYTSASMVGGDLEGVSDGFELAFTRVDSNFSVAIKITRSEPSTGIRGLGKFGLMALERVGGCSRYIMIGDYLPDLQDTRSLSGRTVVDSCDTTFEERNASGPPVSDHPPYYRLQRAGKVFTGWASDDPAVEIDPENHALWTKIGRDDDWGDSVPSRPFIGFANSCTGQTIKFKVIHLRATVVDLDDPPPVLGKKITWIVPRGDVTGGISYDLEYHGKVSLDGRIVNAFYTSGITSIAFEPAQTGPIGAFDNSHDVGQPAAQGSTRYDAATGTYTLRGGGNEIWAGGDEFQFAYKAVTGDFLAEARITRRTNPAVGGRWGRHGLMARSSCDKVSAYSMIQTNLASPGQPIDEPRHESLGKPYEYVVEDGPFPTEGRLPSWMRMVRRGNAIYTYLSEDDGSAAPLKWCLVGSDNDPKRPETLLVGMALTSHANAFTGTIEFDKFRCEPLGKVEEEKAPAKGGVVASDDFPEADGAPPAGFTIVQGGGFAPVVQGGRLRLTEEGVSGSANAVWLPADGKKLADSGFVAEFDAYMTRSGLGKDPSADPGAGLTFAVVEGQASDSFLELASLHGDGGDSLGFEGGPLLKRTEGHPSFAVELDIEAGGGEPRTDPRDSGSPFHDGTYHLGVDVNASVSSIQTNVDFGVPTGALPDIFAPKGAHVEIWYSPTGRIDVYVGANDGAVRRAQVLSAVIPPLSGDVVLGFTGGTGETTCTQEVDNLVVTRLSFDSLPPHGPFIRSDCNSDGRVDISDPIFILGWLFTGGDAPPCKWACDSNCDGSINISDPQYTLSYLFGTCALPPCPAPCSPFPACGLSSAASDVPLGCSTMPPCAPR